MWEDRPAAEFFMPANPDGTMGHRDAQSRELGKRKPKVPLRSDLASDRQGSRFEAVGAGVFVDGGRGPATGESRRRNTDDLYEALPGPVPYSILKQAG